MADNVTVDTITGSPVVATDDIAGVHYQVIKAAHGASDSATLVSTASGLPVQQQGTWTVQPGNTANTTAWLIAGASRSHKTVTGSTSTDADVVTAVGGKRIKVYSISLMVISTTAVTVTMQSNALTALATYPLQGPAAVTVGLTESVEPGLQGAFLFGTAQGEKLTLDVSAAVTVYYNIRYWDDDAA